MVKTDLMQRATMAARRPTYKELRARIAELEAALRAIIKWADELSYYADDGTALVSVFQHGKDALKEKP